jgi:hypothetical protein
MEVLRARFSERKSHYLLARHADEGQIRAYLHSEGAVEHENFENNGDITLNLVLSTTLLEKLYRKFELTGKRVRIKTNTLAGVA